MKKLLMLFLILIVIFSNKKEIFHNTYETVETQILSQNNEKQEITNDEKLSNFQSIKIGDSKEKVISKLGIPIRIDRSEYQFKWYVYKNNREKLVMVGIGNNKVEALFTNSINSCEGERININEDMNYVKSNFIPLNYKTKGNIKFKINSNDEYDIVHKNEKYITAFYDKHNDNKIWSILIISEESEDKNKNVYGENKKKLKESFELQIVDLTNCMRYINSLENLKINEKANESATKHSLDMKENNFFDHNNLKNETPFDRMENESIDYKTAGENIAAGQINAIYAHNGWLNSIGHRKNILGNYTYIGVGVIFGGDYKTYYTENFFG